MEPTYALPLRTPRDLYEKLQREAARLAANVNTVNGDDLFNFVVTAWHLQEWIRKRSPRTHPDFDTDYARLIANPHIRICRDLANGSKHVRLTYGDQTVTKVERRITRAPARFGMAEFGESQFGDGLGASTLIVTAVHAGKQTAHGIRGVVAGVLQAYDDFAAKHPLDSAP